MLRRTDPFPLMGVPVGSGMARDFIPPSTIPWWLAEIAYTRLKIIAGPGAGIEPLATIARRGGFTPLEFLDLIAGGNGDGTTFKVISQRRHSLVSESIRDKIPIIITPGRGAKLDPEK